MKRNRLYLYAPLNHNPYTTRAIESIRCTSYKRAREIARSRNISRATWCDENGRICNVF